MPDFVTPEAISVIVDLGAAGVVRVVASDRADTVVQVRPTDEADESDVKAARQVRAEFANGVLQVTGPKVRALDFSRKSRSVDVSIELPTDSRLSGDLQVGDFHCAGRLGETRIKTSAGNVQLDGTGPLHVETAAGHITVDHVADDAEIQTGTGKVSIGRIEGAAVVKDSNGNIDIGAVTGDVRLRATNGDISVGRAGAGVEAKTGNGSIRLGEVVRGSVTAGASVGSVEVGIAEGSAAWLEVNTGYGRVHNLLENATQPAESDETVEVRARTSFGDITIRRS